MKQLRFIATIGITSAALFFGSCNNSGKDKENKPDSSTTKMDNPPPAAPLSKVMIIKHKVANYDKWKMGYDGHDSARLANGVHSYIIARGTEDSNMVMVAMKIDDVDKAKAMAADPAMKDVMKKAGVTGAAEIDYLEPVMSDTTGITQMVRLMVKHKVKDWDAWKKSFDSHKQARADAGLVDRVVGYTVGDNHQVTLVFSVTDMEKAKAFMKSKDLEDKMKEAGVDGPPSFFFYKVVQKY
jgi:hypothetical protein